MFNASCISNLEFLNILSLIYFYSIANGGTFTQNEIKVFWVCLKGFSFIFTEFSSLELKYT
jgi:hypothetical protein